MQNFWDEFCVFDLKTSCIASHLHDNTISCILRCVFTLLYTYVLVELDWVEPMMQLPLHVTCSCIPMHTYSLFNIFCYIFAAWDFSDCLFLPLSLSLVCISLLLWHPNTNLLHPGTLFIPGHPLHLILLLPSFGSMISNLKRTSQRTFLDEVFIRNAKSFCRTSPTLTYPLSSTAGVGSHCVTSRSLVHSC